LGAERITRRRPHAIAWVRLAAFLAFPLVGGAQQPRSEARRLPSDAEVHQLLQSMRVANAPALAPLVNALLSDTSAHMRPAPRRQASPADSARAAATLAVIRASLARYGDVAAAERDGYVRFLPWLPGQAIVHYNHLPNAIAANRRMDATRPTSLLYREEAPGRLRLVGVMYTAPASATPDELDARLPLGVAHWHTHVNFCAPDGDPASLARQTWDGPTAARWLAISTEAECRAAGGVFVPQLFGWMVHVNAFEGETLEAVWGGHGRDAMGMHPAGHRVP
jgi:hypothetical protein